MAPARKKILIIDDDRSITQTFAFQMKGEGFDVISAEDGAEGWRKVGEEKPDVIVLELVVLKKDGFEILRDIKNLPAGEKIPVVVFSRLRNEHDIEEARELGSVDYFVKSDTTLRHLIEKVKMLGAL